jgi:uncharacterized membrane protein
MSFSPVLVFHIGGGVSALLSGAGAMAFGKGSQRHRAAGNVFVLSMVGLSASGAYLGFTKHQTLNGLTGVLTFYLVVTAWWTARHGDGHSGVFDWAALMAPLAVAGGLVRFGLEAAHSQDGVKDGYPAAAYFIFGFVAMLFAAGDVRMLARGGAFGADRIARHLRRMCFALFIAAGSFFLGQQQVFPETVCKTNVLFIPSFLPLVLMIFWVFHVLYTNKGRAAFGKQSA